MDWEEQEVEENWTGKEEEKRSGYNRRLEENAIGSKRKNSWNYE